MTSDQFSITKGRSLFLGHRKVVIGHYRIRRLGRLHCPTIMTAFREPLALDSEATLFPRVSHALRRVQLFCGLAGVVAVIGRHGVHDLPSQVARSLAVTVVACLLIPAVGQGLRYAWSRARPSFVQEYWLEVSFSLAWLVGVIGIAVLARPLGWTTGGERSLTALLLGWCEVLTILRGLHELYLGIRLAADLGLNPALVLVLSFAALIGSGTILLMLPRCRPVGEPAAPWLTALFTSTSACCVTGLNVVDPGTYWSRTGQWVILGLIQLGGLGIMTFGGFFAFALGRQLPMREQVTFRELLESERLGDVGSLVRAIIGFTLGIELIGAALLTTLWPELPWSERLFYGLFHAVSAFCNAGFALRSNNFMGWELQWQVWGVVTLLIILGGLGFSPMNNLRRVLASRGITSAALAQGQRHRLWLSTRLALITTVGLLVGGTVVLLLLEWNNPAHPAAWPNQLANAWFHSVTLRTAGFNTIDHEQLHPASKVVGVMLMFVGASPGSTGGGVKTICFALTVLTLRSVLHGRPAVEVGGRTIPQEQVFRGLAIIAIALTTLVVSCLCLVIIEDQPDRFIDHLYEATSALGTVGVSANLTPTLQPGSLLVLIATMFLGRVGPLTLIIALAGSSHPRNYAYPEERIALG
jgi:trk system potassium uptake protein